MARTTAPSSSRAPSSTPRASGAKRAKGTTAKRRSSGSGAAKGRGKGSPKTRARAAGGPRSSTRRRRAPRQRGVAARAGDLALAGLRHAYGWVAPRVRFAHVLAALLLAVLYVHDVRLEWGAAATAAGPGGGRGAGGTPTARLASFAHPSSHSAADVEQLRADYIAAYAPLARAEMEAYGIPASITLAQGLLESVAGTSRLATATNNHFGIKCFSRRCAPGHCRNFGDDHHKDFFRAYDHPRESYRAHSEFLRNGTRYARLFELDADDYAAWARGLSAAGYATDPAYADKLIGLVERYGLDAYDEAGGWF